MPTLLDRNNQILSRIAGLARLGPAISRVLVAGKLRQLADGTDAQGRPYAPLAASTLRQRRDSGPPLGGSDTALARSYSVEVSQKGDGLVARARFAASYSTYLRTGTRKMPRRDPGGFRPEDSKAAIEMVRKEVFRG